MARPDGTGERIVVGAPSPGLGLAWSPDERRWVARCGGKLNLVEVATGAVLPLPCSANMLEPAWRP